MTGMVFLLVLLAVFGYFAVCDHRRGVRPFHRMNVPPGDLR